jgi:hypothetical protein
MKRAFLAVALIAGVACGGSSSSGVMDPASDAGSDATPGDAPYTLDNVCDRLPPIECDLRKSCCGADFDQAGCVAHARATCEKNVAEARAGSETFHPDRIPGCIEQYHAVFASCTLTFDLLQKYARDIGSCEAFTGQGAVGTTCERTAQCQPGSNANELGGCDDDTKKCKITKILAEGATCSLEDGLTGICDDGLYCDVDFKKQPATGVCKKKTSLGVACDKSKKPVPLECGLGNYCPEDAPLCTAGKAGGAACTSDVECATVKCEKPDAGATGTCKTQQPLSKPAECKGP